jgi:hypothetical protein
VLGLSLSLNVEGAALSVIRAHNLLKEMILYALEVLYLVESGTSFIDSLQAAAAACFM